MKSVVSTLSRTSLLFVATTTLALAQDGGGNASWGPLGAGLAIGLAALGCGLGQGRTASAALEGMARNPQAAGSLFTPMIIGLALIESLCILGFVVAQGLT
jgi:F-type H+-transporting ATPase subunit c